MKENPHRMTDINDSEETKSANLSELPTSEWTKQLYEKGVIHLNENGSMGITFPSPLDRKVKTGPIDRLTVYWDPEDVPRLFMIKKVDGKQRIILSVDSNRIPEAIHSLQKRSEVWIRRGRYAMWSLILLSSLSFMIEVLYGIEFPDYTAVPRFIIFLISVILYGLVGRIYLHGVAIAETFSIYACSECGEVDIKMEQIDARGFVNCQNCDGDMVPLMESKPSTLEDVPEEMEKIIHHELKKIVDS